MVEFAESCNCQKGVPYPDGTLPIYTTKKEDAIQKWVLAVRQRDTNRYWGIHLNNLHINTVHIPGLCRHCPQVAHG